jgi:S1-C subfamily serine protease
MLIVLLALLGLSLGCAGQGNHTVIANSHLSSPQLQEKVRRIVSSVVGVAAVFDYRLEFFYHEMAEGRFITDATSPTGYRLTKERDPITVAQKVQKVNGGGLIIYRDERKTLILTSEHILTSPDTILTFLRDAAGKTTNVPSTRAIKKRVTYHVIDQINQLVPAEVLHTDARADLGLVTVVSSPALGMPFPSTIAYKSEVQWGDLAYVFGYPREIKQLTTGIISPAPYPGTFSLDVVGRFGFSGGPVFVIRPDGELELAGIIRGVPVSKFSYVAPPPEALPGQNLAPGDLPKMTAEEFDLIEYGTVYAIGAEKIGRFLKASVPLLEKKGIYLPRQWLP